MKNLKKLLAIVVSMTMVLSASVVLASAKSYPDVTSDSNAYEAVSILSGLGIVQGDEEGNYNPDATLKRSEAAAILCRLTGNGNVATATTSQFSDVATDHWAAGYINTAASLGYINGMGDGTFEPDSTLKYQDFVKMLVEACGYGPTAANKGGYPVGYLVAGANAGITYGITVTSGEAEASRAVVAKLAYNAIDAPIMEQTGFGIYAQYTIYDGKNGNDKRTLASERLDVAKAKATVLANNRTDISGKSGISRKKDVDPQVKVEITDLYDVEYNDYEVGDTPTVYVGETTASDYLGYDTIVYIQKDDNDDDVIRAIVPETSKTDTLDVTKDIAKEKTGFSASGLTFYYWEDKEADRDATEVEVAADAYVVYNGMGIGRANNVVSLAEDYTEIIKNADEVKFVGPNNGDYDKVFITCYKYGLVEEVNAEDKEIATKNGDDLGVIDLDNRSSSSLDFDYTITYDGNRIGLEDLQENDVLNVIFESNDMNDYDFCDIIVTRDTVEGTITGKSAKTDEDGMYEYTFNNDNAVTYDPIKEKGDYFDLNDSGTFYLSITNKIVDFVQGGEDILNGNYGFITKMGEKKDGMDASYEVKLFTMDGSLVKYETADKLKVRDYSIGDGKGTSKTYYTSGNHPEGSMIADFVADYIEAGGYLKNATDPHIEKRLVTYKISNGYLDTLTIAGSNVGENNNYNFKKTPPITYKPDLNMLGSYDVKDSSKLFYVPFVANATPDKDGYTLDETKIELRSFSSLDRDSSASAYVFNIKSDNAFDVAVMTEDISMASRDALAVVNKVSKATDDDGDYYALSFVQGGKNVGPLKISDDADYYHAGSGDTKSYKLHQGDVFQYTVNGKNEINKITLIYDAENRELMTEGYAMKPGASKQVDSKTTYAFGIITKRTSNRLTISNQFGSEATDKDILETEGKVAFATSGAAVTSLKSVRIQDGGTVARFDEAKSSNYLQILNSASSVSQSNTSGSKGYLAVIKMDEDSVTDIVQITLDATTADEAASVLNGVNFVINPKKSVDSGSGSVNVATPAPTVEPTATPVPTVEPTVEPTTEPTVEPTATPDAE